MWENKEFILTFEKNTMRDFERVMLSSGQCSFFMPMGFMGGSRGETVCYDCSGFAPLSSYRIEKTEDALYIIERVLMILGKSAEYLIMPAKVSLSMDTVFYNKESGEVKIAYVPLTGENLSLRRNLVNLIRQLEKDICDGKKELLVEIARYILYNNYYIKDILNKVTLFKRKIYLGNKESMN